MKFILAAAILATLSTQANADVDTSFRDAVMKCWSKPDVDGVKYSLIWNVEIDSSGELEDITSATPKPTEGPKRVIVESIKRAVMRCAPYSGFKAGVYKLEVNEKVKGGKSLNPYK